MYVGGLSPFGGKRESLVWVQWFGWEISLIGSRSLQLVTDTVLGRLWNL